MFRDLATTTQTGLIRRLSALLGFAVANKQTLSCRVDRASALDDPATRRALADLPAHLLLDIGARDQHRHDPQPQMPDGEALRRHMW